MYYYYYCLGDIRYASGTYRAFKLPQHAIQTKAQVTYMGTVPDCAESFKLDASNSFEVFLNFYIRVLRFISCPAKCLNNKKTANIRKQKRT